MNKSKISQEEFAHKLNEVLSVANPVRKSEYLKGRDRQMKQIARTMASRGRSIFVWGPRGVGKTSVAQTAAFSHQPRGTKPVLLTCDKNTNAGKLILNLVEELLGEDAIPGAKASFHAKLNLGMLEVGARRDPKEPIPPPTTINEAVRILKAALEIWGQGDANRIPVIVIDEFDLLKTSDDRQYFGDLIKQIGDQSLPIHLIFCGVLHSLQDILEGHASAHRYLESVELERLDFDARFGILKTAGDKLDANFVEDHLIRIAQISDGFPYYIHLIGCMIFWEMYEDPKSGKSITAKYYEDGLKKAVEECDANLRHLYEKATRKYTGGYDEVLWAVVAKSQLIRSSSDIFDDYCRIERIIQKQHDYEPDRRAFNTKMNRLKTSPHGSVLEGNRQGWYEFRLPILRGYCRLMAKNAGIDLGEEYSVSKPIKAPK